MNANPLKIIKSCHAYNTIARLKASLFFSIFHHASRMNHVLSKTWKDFTLSGGQLIWEIWITQLNYQIFLINQLNSVQTWSSEHQFFYLFIYFYLGWASFLSWLGMITKDFTIITLLFFFLCSGRILETFLRIQTREIIYLYSKEACSPDQDSQR
jgi:hypothetical protein